MLGQCGEVCYFKSNESKHEKHVWNWKDPHGSSIVSDAVKDRLKVNGSK